MWGITASTNIIIHKYNINHLSTELFNVILKGIFVTNTLYKHLDF